MSKKNKDADKLVTVQVAVPVIVWRANRPMNDEQYDALKTRLQAAEAHTGVKVMLVPHSVDVEVSAEISDQPTESNAGAGESND